MGAATRQPLDREHGRATGQGMSAKACDWKGLGLRPSRGAAVIGRGEQGDAPRLSGRVQNTHNAASIMARAPVAVEEEQGSLSGGKSGGGREGRGGRTRERGTREGEDKRGGREAKQQERAGGGRWGGE